MNKRPFPEDLLESTVCPVCRSPERKTLLPAEPFFVVKCRNCNIIYLNPRLKEPAMKNLYNDGHYYSSKERTGYGDYLSQERGLRLTFKSFINKLDLLSLTNDRLLEVGCGYGFFLDEAKKHYSYVAGTELSEDAGRYAGALTGADVFIGELTTIPHDLRDFDIIVAINVIEHIYSPIDFLASVRERLGMNGHIVLATPDIGSFWYKILKSRWPSFKIPEHVVFYSQETLADLLKRSGFKNPFRIKFAHAFPLGLVLGKLGLNLDRKLTDIPVWVPKTMTAVSAQKSSSPTKDRSFQQGALS